MKLSDAEIKTFYKIWYILIWNINQKHKIVPDFKKPVYGKSVNTEQFIAIRDKLWENPQWIDEFLCDSDNGELTETERGILAGWRNNFVKGDFVLLKHIAKYSIFLAYDSPGKLYGVSGISDPIKEMVGLDVPFVVKAVLLPFNGKIIYDSFIATYSISFSKNTRNDLKISYNKIKETTGIIESFSAPPVPVKPLAKKTKPKEQNQSVSDTKGIKIPREMSGRYMEIAEIINNFCDDKLDAEYKEICLRALQKLCRKRPSPLVSGKARTWACGIVYAIGSVNFIFDKTQPINMTATEISEWFELSKSTAGSKAAEINKLLDLSYFNTEFLLEKYIEDNPAIWYLMVNGLIVDIRDMPLELQEEASRKGLIPYIPGKK